MRTTRTLTMFAIIIALVVGLTLLIGNPMDFLSYNCERMAQSMNAPYYYHPADGCLIQQPDGTWREYGNTNHQP